MLRHAEDILDVASEGDRSAQDILILVDHQGGMRIMNAAGWSESGVRAEFGAMAVYKVEQRSGAVRVEGWMGPQRCLIQRDREPVRLSDLPGIDGTGYATILQVPGTALVCSNERSPQVLNS